MEEKSNKKYIAFPLIVIILLLIATFLGYHHEGIYEILKEYDMTGTTSIFMHVMLILEIIVLIFCIYKGKKGIEEGFDYLFSKFACVIFIVLILIPIISFSIVRNEEEKMATELDNKYNETFGNNYVDLTKKGTMKKVQEYSEIQENDEFYKRKKEISSEMKNQSKMGIFFRYFVINGYNYNLSYKPYLSTEERYYAIYSRISVINIICLIFYLSSLLIDQNTNRTRKNFRRN